MSLVVHPHAHRRLHLQRAPSIACTWTRGGCGHVEDDAVVASVTVGSCSCVFARLPLELAFVTRSRERFAFGSLSACARPAAWAATSSRAFCRSFPPLYCSHHLGLLLEPSRVPGFRDVSATKRRVPPT
eukprot:scaffold244762_cov33-Tisochrysis_lutea.AAC.1